MSSSKVISLVRIAVVLIVAGGSTGCATIVKGTSQKVPIASDPPAADVLVDGNLVGQTPTAVQMKRKQDHLVTIKKEGYEPKSVAVVKDVGGAVWGNIIAGGLIGWGVDATSGAQYNLVPQTISVKLDSAQMDGASKSNDQSEFVSKLKALDQLHESKQISDEEYGKGRLEIFKQYMPELLPKDASAGAAK